MKIKYEIGGYEFGGQNLLVAATGLAFGIGVASYLKRGAAVGIGIAIFGLIAGTGLSLLVNKPKKV